MSLYKKKFPTELNQYSQFYLDIKQVANLSYTDATKFVKKIGFFTKFFEIPVTYWLLIEIHDNVIIFFLRKAIINITCNFEQYITYLRIIDISYYF